MGRLRLRTLSYNELVLERNIKRQSLQCYVTTRVQRWVKSAGGKL